ncbi:MAG: CpsD/CapB family tyrosine-protein kinase [Acidobacteriaceae bacterium]|nr:CpsD/CapB family tyrosine-protein kinase [Acidobacteriaceae bacterium]
MSRIYEALQKAESERQVNPDAELDAQLAEAPVNPEQELSAFDAAEPAIWPVETTESANGTHGGLPEDGLSISPSVLVEASRQAGISRIGTGFNPEKITRVPWAPLIDRLPATMERGLAVEQFRSLRSRLFELRDIKPLKTILITSGMPQEGKSFVAVNLAISLARHKSSKVLLIDGDMRRYTLHEVLGCECAPGLAEYLAGENSLMDVVQKPAIAEDEIGPVATLANITFISGGRGGDRSADLSGNPRFRELIQTVSRYYDWIIIDSSPVLPVSDAVNLARSSDGVLLVARSGVTKYDIAQRAQSEMKASNILGFVLNASDGSPAVNSYYGYDSQ